MLGWCSRICPCACYPCSVRRQWSTLKPVQCVGHRWPCWWPLAVLGENVTKAPTFVWAEPGAVARPWEGRGRVNGIHLWFPYGVSSLSSFPFPAPVEACSGDVTSVTGWLGSVVGLGGRSSQERTAEPESQSAWATGELGGGERTPSSSAAAF